MIETYNTGVRFMDACSSIEVGRPDDVIDVRLDWTSDSGRRLIRRVHMACTVLSEYPFDRIGVALHGDMCSILEDGCKEQRFQADAHLEVFGETNVWIVVNDPRFGDSFKWRLIGPDNCNMVEGLTMCGSIHDVANCPKV